MLRGTESTDLYSDSTSGDTGTKNLDRYLLRLHCRTNRVTEVDLRSTPAAQLSDDSVTAYRFHPSTMTRGIADEALLPRQRGMFARDCCS